MLWFDYALLAVLGLAPSILWLVFFEREEAVHPTPLRDTALIFIIGALTTFIALAGQMGVMQYYLEPNHIAQHSKISIAIFAAIEEILKFLFVYLIVKSRGILREPLDAMIYLITASLGFAAVENIAILVTQGGAITSAIPLESAILRTLGATLLHSVTAGVMGFHWAIGIIRHKFIAFHIIAGVVIASALHGIFNYLTITTGPASWGIVFAAIIGFFVLVDFEELRAQEGIPPR